MDVGLFTTVAATAPTVPSGTTLVRTSGYNAPGSGQAEYAYDSTRTSGFIAAHPRCAFLDASGRVFRLVENPINILMTGAVANTATNSNNYDAICAARDYLAAVNLSGGSIYVPAGRFYVSDKLVFKAHVRLFGEGNTQNPGFVGGTSYGFPTYYNSSVLYFEDGKGGLDFLPFTDEEDMLTVSTDIATNGNSSTYYEFQQALRSIVRDIFIVSESNGSGTFVEDANGIQFRTTMHLENVWVHGFRGHGIRSEGTQNGAGVDGAMFGATNQSCLINCMSKVNVGDGFHNDGYDANVILFLSCDGSSNGAWGFNDEGLLGDTYVNCHATNNNTRGLTSGGSFRASSGVAPHTFIGCYIEDTSTPTARTELSEYSVVIGGIMASSTYFPSDARALVLNGYGAFRGKLGGINDLGTGADVRGGVGRDPTQTEGTAMWWGSADDSEAMDAYRLKYNSTAKSWSVEFANAGSTTTPIQYPGGGATWRTTALYAPSFPQGIILGINGAGPRLHYGTAAPTTGNWQRGDMVLNSNAATGAPSFWQCTVSGAPGTFAAGPNL